MNVHEGGGGITICNDNVDPVRCSTCFEAGIEMEMPKCTYCINAYHSNCANVPSGLLKSDFFCRWTCFTNYHPKQQVSSKNSIKTTAKCFVQVENKQFAARVQKALTNLLLKKEYPQMKTSSKNGEGEMTPESMTATIVDGGKQVQEEEEEKEEEEVEEEEEEENIKSGCDYKQNFRPNIIPYASQQGHHLTHGEEEAHGLSQRHATLPYGYDEERGGNYLHGQSGGERASLRRIPHDQAVYTDDNKNNKKRPRDHEEWSRMAKASPSTTSGLDTKIQARRPGIPVGPNGAVAPVSPAVVGHHLYGSSHGNQGQGGGFLPLRKLNTSNTQSPAARNGGILLAPFNPQIPDGNQRVKSNSAAVPLLPKLAPVMISSSTDGRCSGILALPPPLSVPPLSVPVPVPPPAPAPAPTLPPAAHLYTNDNSLSSSNRSQQKQKQYSPYVNAEVFDVPSSILPLSPLPKKILKALKKNLPWRKNHHTGGNNGVDDGGIFPTSLFERFPCSTDDFNGVFRIDLTDVFASTGTSTSTSTSTNNIGLKDDEKKKKKMLYQNEIDFFYRCLETSKVSLIIKGMASNLNPYIWAWPFILESCGSSSCFVFDHFQFLSSNREQERLEEQQVQYIGQLYMTMTQYHHYLENFLSTCKKNEPISLRDEKTKKIWTIFPQKHLITINALSLAECNTQLYNDLMKSFQWDVFPGGNHCLLQYVPFSCRPKKKMNPIFHLNFPGARSSLVDPGNGTTDTIYQMLVGTLELIIFERLEPQEKELFKRILQRIGFDFKRKEILLEKHLHHLEKNGFHWSTMLIQDGEFIHINKGRMHFWRVIESTQTTCNEKKKKNTMMTPCVFLTWEWVYQGVSQRGISHECWFAAKSAALCQEKWAFDPRRAIVEAAKRGLSIVRTGEFLSSTHAMGEIHHPFHFCSFSSNILFTKEAIFPRQEQIILFLESILPCIDTIVEDEFDSSVLEDDSHEFTSILSPEDILWTQIDSLVVLKKEIEDEDEDDEIEDEEYDDDYTCGICGLELSNCYKQCFGCALYARERKPNQKYSIFRICLRCHALSARHFFRSKKIDQYFGPPLSSSEGHTGILPFTRRYQAVRSYFKCDCRQKTRKQCRFCGGCETCACICHALFQTRFRFESPEYIDRLRIEITDIVKWHKHHQAS